MEGNDDGYFDNDMKLLMVLSTFDIEAKLHKCCQKKKEFVRLIIVLLVQPLVPLDPSVRAMLVGP